MGISRVKTIREAESRGKNETKQQQPVHTEQPALHRNVGSTAWCQREQRMEPEETKGKGLGSDAAQAEADPGGPVGEEQDWRSLVQLFCVKACPAHVNIYDVFTENAVLHE